MIPVYNVPFVAPDHAPCATMQMMASAPPLVELPLASLGGGLSLRDSFGVPNVTTGQHFAVRWGDSGGISPGEAEAVLDSFEYGWDVEIDEMNYPPPATTSAFYFNVYIGDTGGGTPSVYGNGGYYTVDYDGYPYIVIDKNSLFDDEYIDTISHHEFYHAIQGSLNRFPYEDDAAWFWEATAEWVTLEVNPNSPYNGAFVYSYLLLPRLPVDFFDYPDTGALQELHQYGAFLFPHHLSDTFGTDIIRDAWVEPGSETSPIEVMRDWLSDRGESLDEEWLDHLGRNAVYDYDDGDLFRSWVDYVGSYYGSEDQRILATVTGSGGDGSVSNQAPMRYGSATIEVDDPDDGEITVHIEGDEQGTQGSPTELGARLVIVDGDGFHYHDVDFDGTTGDLTVPIRDAEEAWLAVGTWTENLNASRWTTERFPFSWSIDISPAAVSGDDDDDDDDDGGGGGGGKKGKHGKKGKGGATACAVGATGAVSWLGALSALSAMLVRRRR